MLADVKTGEELIDYLRSTEPVFMKEVGRFVTIELDKLKPDFPGDEDFLMYLGSVLGAAYIMGFLVAREMDHKIYDGLIDFDSVLNGNDKDPNYLDKFIDKNLEEGKKPKEIGKLLKRYMSEDGKKKRKPTKGKKKKKSKRVDIDFDEGEL